jgi:hypothetical protein
VPPICGSPDFESAAAMPCNISGLDGGLLGFVLAFSAIGLFSLKGCNGGPETINRRVDGFPDGGGDNFNVGGLIGRGDTL